MSDEADGPGWIVFDFPLWTVVNAAEFDRVGFPQAIEVFPAGRPDVNLLLFPTELAAEMMIGLIDTTPGRLRAAPIADAPMLSAVAKLVSQHYRITHAAFKPGSAPGHPAEAYIRLSDLAAGPSPRR